MQSKAAKAAPLSSTHTRRGTTLQANKDTRTPQPLKLSSQQALGLQAELRMGKVDDPYERQADHVADKVLAGDSALFADTRPLKPALSSLPSPRSPSAAPQGKEKQRDQLQANEKDKEQLQATPEQAEQLQAKAEEDEELQASQDEAEQLQAKAEEDEELQSKQEEPEQLQAKAEEGEELQAKAEDNDELQARQEEPEQLQAKPEEDEELQGKAKDDEKLQAVQDEAAPLQAKAEEDEELQAQGAEEDSMQAQTATAGQAAEPQQAMQTARQHPGSPLQARIQQKMEQAFAQDFSGVRIHTDQAAVVLNQQLGARALTSGQDIYFNAGEFQPASREGEHLLAHELTHVVQQRDAANTPIQLQAQAEPESYQIRPELLKAVNNARSKIGLVNAKITDADGNRVGWELLNEFFNTAFGGQHPLNAQVIQKIVMGKDANGKPKDALPSWCGIFVWWSLKTAGLPIPDWKLGLPVMQYLKPRPKSELPRKGDIAYRELNQHFAIVSGVELQGGVPRVATINGNTAGQDNLGGQIQEQWHGLDSWLGFFDTAAKLDLPEVPLVSTGSGTDALQSDEPANTVAASSESEIDSAVENESAELSDPALDAPIAAPALESPSDAEVVAELPDIPPAPAIEPSATIDPLQLDGSSDKAISTVAQASASQLALDGDQLGGAVSSKLQSEQQAEIGGTPELQVNLAGNVDEGMTPADQLLPASAQLDDKSAGPEPAPLEAKPHEFAGPAPSNEERNENLEKEAKSEGFLGWLKANFRSLMNAIRTDDPNLSTRAGPAPKVALDGSANPQQMGTQRTDAGNQLRGKRDELTDDLKAHPGQGNIQAKAVQEAKPVAMQNPEPAPVTTTAQPEAGDYAEAELPQNIRDKADEELGKQMGPSLDKANQDAIDAADTKQSDKKTAISDAEKETGRLNKAADAEQRTLVIDNRKQVADKQKAGIEQAYGTVNTFETDAGKEQTDKNKLIGDKVKEKEGEADKTLKDAEGEAEAKKKAEEKKARDKKQELDEAQKKESWWDRAKNAVKSAVKAITSAIDSIFTALRDAVKTLIDKAKNLAIAAINAARNFVVEKLNDFRDWAKNQVNTYLGSTFPGLAAAINNGIDAVVDVAITGVNMAADGAIAAVEAVANALAAALDKILSVFQTALKAAVEIIGAVLTGDFVEALKIAIRAACDIAGIDSKPIFDFLERAGAQLISILKKPVPFFNNLVSAVGLGARNFVKNIKQHLIKGLIGWLTGALSETPITLPETFDVKGIFSLVMQILGLTYANIRARVIKKYPAAEKVISAIEKGVEIVHLLITKGPIALWDMVKESMANLKEMVMGAIRNFVITTVIKEAVTWLLGLLNPAGALVKILKLLFDLVMFLVERFNQIKDFVLSVYNALSSLASGVIGQAAAAVENAMARSLPVIIGLLASLAGLGGIGKTVQGIIQKVTAPINKVIDAVIDKIVGFAKKLLGKGKAAAKKVKDKLVQWWKVKRKFKAVNGEQHTLFFKGSEKSAVLTMRSEEQPYHNFLDSLDEKNFDSTQKPHLGQAKVVAKKIDAKRKEAVGGKDEAEKAANAKAKEAALDALLIELGESTKHLFGTALPDWEEPDYGGGPNSAGFGVSMEIKVLTKQGDGWKNGSTPTQAAHSNYDILNQRRQSGGASFYIRGHLLNDNLGGPGQWKNMTPLSREGNHQHEAQVESYVKAGFNAKAIQRYKVVPKYSGHGGDAALKKELAAKHPTQASTFNAIIDAEKHVPVTLKIEAARLVKKGNGYQEKDKKSWNLANPLQRSADKYFLSNSPKIVPVNINALTSAKPLLDFNHAEINLQAPAILKALQARQADSKPGFGTYAVLARETVDQGGSLTETQAKGWNSDGYILLK
jgi:hypothetical protein